MRLETVSPRGMLAAVVVSALFAASCEYKRALPYPRQAEVITSLASPSSLRIDHFADADKNRSVLNVAAQQTETAAATRKIVRNGSLELLVGDVGQVAGKIRVITEGLNGFVEKSTQTNVGGRGAAMTLRVPSASLDQAMAEIERLALSVDRESVEARDVTRDYIDLDARLRNARAEEEEYLKILKRATTVKDTLDGAEKLSDVRGRIEQLQGEMKYLTGQIDMSSLDVSLHGEASATVLGIQWRPLRQAKIALREMISGLADWADTVLAFFINLPLILVWVGTILLVIAIAVRFLRLAWKKLWPKTAWRLPWLRSGSKEQTKQTN